MGVVRGVERVRRGGPAGAGRRRRRRRGRRRGLPVLRPVPVRDPDLHRRAHRRRRGRRVHHREEGQGYEEGQAGEHGVRRAHTHRRGNPRPVTQVPVHGAGVALQQGAPIGHSRPARGNRSRTRIHPLR